MELIFQNRKQAGRLLAEELQALPSENFSKALVLALPRGGVPVGYEIAKALHLPLEVLIVRKIGHPLYPEYGIGAVAEEGFYWFDPDATGLELVSVAEIASVVHQEKSEVLRRIEIYRPHHLLPYLRGKNIILVDDGLATGVTARVAARYLRAHGAEKIILAAPVCAEATLELLRPEVNEVVCLTTSSDFSSVGHFYKDFEQLEDSEVVELLETAHAESTEILEKREQLRP